MKTRKINLLTLLLLAATVGGGVAYLAGVKPVTPSESTLAALSQVPVVELPAAAAALVQQAQPETRAVLVTEIIRDTVALRGCALPYVVSAIAKQAPENAPVAVVTAAKLQPVDTLASVKAAINSAPDQTEAIVFAFAREFPEAYPTVAVLAASERPQQSIAILQAIGKAIPDLKPFVERIAAQFGAGQMDMLSALVQVERLAAAAVREQDQSTRDIEVKKVLAAQAPNSRPKTQFPTLEQFAKAEITRAEAAVSQPSPAIGSTRSLASRTAPSLVVPAPLKVPAPSEIKTMSADFGVRDSRTYSRP